MSVPSDSDEMAQIPLSKAGIDQTAPVLGIRYVRLSKEWVYNLLGESSSVPNGKGS